MQTCFSRAPPIRPWCVCVCVSRLISASAEFQLWIYSLDKFSQSRRANFLFSFCISYIYINDIGVRLSGNGHEVHQYGVNGFWEATISH